MVAGDFNGDGKADLAVEIIPPNGGFYLQLNVNPLVNVLLGKGDGTFAAPATYSVVSTPSEDTALLSFLFGFPALQTLAAGDLNGDGKLDLAVAGGKEVNVLYNKGDGTFTPTVTNTVKPGSFVAIGDFNGDGRQDLLTAGGLLLNNGDGTFAAPTPIGTSFSRAAVVGHFRSSTALDLALIDRTNATVEVLFNNSSAAATPGMYDPTTATWYFRNTATGGAPDLPPFQYGMPGWDGLVGDWTGDGIRTVGAFDPSTATWYLRNHTSGGSPDAGVFQYGMPGDIPLVGDWSGTGRDGIGVFDPTTATWYLRNEPDAGAPNAGVFHYGGSGWIPVVGDWNGLGRDSIGVVRPQTMTWYLRNETSGGAPDAAVPFVYGQPGERPVAGDWDGNGTSTPGVIDASGVWKLRNSNSEGFPDITPFPFGLGSWTPLAGHYVPLDNRPHNGVSGPPSSPVIPGAPAALTDRNQVSPFRDPVAYSAGPAPSVVATGDLRGTGLQDLITLSFTNDYNGHTSGTVDVEFNNGDGTFAAPVSYAVSGDPVSVAGGDFNGDGKLDLAVGIAAPIDAFGYQTTGPSGRAQVSVFLNKGDGTFIAPVTIPVGPTKLPGTTTPPPVVTAADLSGDGKDDLIVGFAPTPVQETLNYKFVPAQPAQVNVLLSNGDGTFAPAMTTTLGAPPQTGDFASAIALAVGDFNGDGKMDLAAEVVNPHPATIDTPSFSPPPQVFVLPSKGDGTFAAPAVSMLGPGTESFDSRAQGIAVGDLNGDGKTDIVVATGNGLSILTNKGDGTFSVVSYAVTAGPFVAVGDFNGDGLNDIATNAGLLVNQGNGTFSAPIPYPGGSFQGAGAVGHFHPRSNLDVAGLDYTIGTKVEVLLNNTTPPATPGMYDPTTATWYLRTSTRGGPPDIAFQYGMPGWEGFVGDWTGDGLRTVGAFDPNTATWYLRNHNSGGAPDAGVFQFGMPGDVPLVGDWNVTGHDGIGVFDPRTATWYLRNEANAGPPDAGVFQFGMPGDVPLVGDWNSIGHDGIGVFNPTSATWNLRNESNGGTPDAGSFPYGEAGWKPVTGDFGGRGTTGIVVVDPNGVWYVRNSATGGGPDYSPFPFGMGSWTPLAGPF
jgi:hypothetical protein